MDEQIAEQTETPIADELPSTTVEVRRGRRRRTGIMLVLFVFTKLYNAGTDFHFQSYKLEITTALALFCCPSQTESPFLVCSQEEHKR